MICTRNVSQCNPCCASERLADEMQKPAYCVTDPQALTTDTIGNQRNRAPLSSCPVVDLVL